MASMTTDAGPPDAAATPRRTMPAGYVLAIIVGALTLGLLLNAADIRRTANRQEQGWMRTVSIAMIEPVYDLSHTLWLDRPRAALDAMLGRETLAGEPEPEPEPAVLASPQTTSTTSPTTTTTTQPTRRVITAAEPLVMYIGGDSMVGQFGPMLQNRANRSGMVTSEFVYEFESGLSRPDFIDWPARLSQVSAELDPDVFVLFFGGNDAQGIYMPDGTWIDFGTPEWEAEYRARVDGVMTALEENGHWVYWMGMPVVQSETFQPRVDLMNRIYEETAASHPNVTFVPTAPVFTGPDGGYSEYLTNSEGDLADMRLDDGVHFTTDGAIRLADHLFPTIA
ncbi:MAG: DUF459 domain-containing protein, partial [Acidimicrobiia bacterium]